MTESKKQALITAFENKREELYDELLVQLTRVEEHEKRELVQIYMARYENLTRALRSFRGFKTNG